MEESFFDLSEGFIKSLYIVINCLMAIVTITILCEPNPVSASSFSRASLMSLSPLNDPIDWVYLASS